MSSPACKHCGANCGKVPIIYNSNAFCCNGCQQVYQLLNEFKLNQYYSLAEAPGVRVDDKGYDDKYAYLDNDEVKVKLYEFHESDIAKITFYIPAIHCISCIWLLEHLNRLHAGIKQSAVNFTEKKITVSFNTSEITLRQLVELLVSIHYIPQISLQELEPKPQKTGNKALLYKIGVAGFVFGNVMMYSFPQYFNGKPLTESPFFNYLSLFLTIPLVFYSGSDYLVAAFKNLRKKIIVIDLPIALGILALFAVTLYDVLSGTGQGYSDSLSGLLFFLLVGKWYQSKTYQALSFDRDYKSYFPVAVTKISGAENQSILLKDVTVGDRLLIRNNELIPADSVLVEGTALIDYSFVTGESTPVRKDAGEFLYAGGVQTRGAIVVETTREINQGHLTRLWNQSDTQVENGKSIATTIDRLSGYFTIWVIVIAIGGFVWWYLAGDMRTATLVFTSVLIVTCPCALALSQPFTLGNAMRMLGLNGMYIKNTQVIEKLTQIDTVVFDKTGTITIPDQNNIVFHGETLTRSEIIALVSLASQSAHPLSSAIAKHYNDVETVAAEGFVEVPGRGIFAKVNGHEYRIGSLGYVSAETAGQPQPSSAVYVSVNNVVKGYFRISNQYRNGIGEVMGNLSKHFELYLLSGDNDSERENLKKYIKPAHLFFDQKPQDKMDFIAKLRKQGRTVLMTGDGLNDAGAFIQSDVGLSIADDIYHFSPAGDAIIEASKFGRLYEFISYARKSMLVLKISLAISLLYNVIGLAYALSGTLSPVVGAILMPISSVSVVAFATLGTRMLAGRMAKNK